MPGESPVRPIRLSDEHWSRLGELGRHIAPRNPMIEVQVIRLLIDQAWTEEFGKKKSRKKTEPTP